MTFTRRADISWVLLFKRSSGNEVFAGEAGGSVASHRPTVGEGIIVSSWETEADAKESETNPPYIGQMSVMSSFLSERLAPQTYQVDVQA
jgi:hypothetical protein